MLDLIKNIRCNLHQIPELGRKEFKTKEYILEYVKDFNCKVYTPTETSVVLHFDLNKENTLCFRADMDALPIKEVNDISYKSTHEGLMHACGHDGHMAMLLGFAKYASMNLDKLENNIVCLFQPSEEDDAGANDIIKSGILDKLNIDAIFGFHLWPTLKEGEIFTKEDGLLATSAEIDIDILGKSVHAANRKDGIDALLIGSKLINEVYDLFSKIEKPHLISFGKFNSGEVRNSVSSLSHIEATLRAFDDETFKYMTSSLESILKRIKNETNCEYKLKINAAYPSVLNDSKLVLNYKELLNLNILEKPFLQAEDFGCYTRIYPSMFMLIGIGDDTKLHTNNFNFNMDVLEVGYLSYQKLACNKYIK